MDKSNNNNNNNNDNDNDDENWIWDMNYGSTKYLEQISEIKVATTKGSNEHSNVIGTKEFLPNTGIKTWLLKLTCLSEGNWTFYGVCREEDIRNVDIEHYYFSYGWSSIGQKFSNNRNFCSLDVNNYNFESMMVYLYLNTDNGELKTKSYSTDGSIINFESSLTGINFPVYPIILLSNNHNEVELIGINQYEDIFE
eukprot:TRINITY_DN819_c4_g1_i1.p1 TRINITY_DN819_c4_g1~~TRINITY_DN819_c4_g1_i1.p1  ORF type:complete len:196 (+),score=44.41 TRINITY_DN819_c4_g1_i1:89-676(+)